MPAIILLAGALGAGDTPARPPTVNASFTVRNAHALAHDSRHQRTVLFGGADESQVLGDTWVWAPAERRWRPVPGLGPDARTFPAMTFDGRREVVVLFGGNRVLFGRDPSADTFLADTWLLRGEHWTQLQVSGPSARAEAAVAYDAWRGVVVLFGGYRRRAGEMERLGDTWEWDGRRWAQVTSTGPSPRNGAVMAYHQQRGRVLLFGGRGPSNETWEWDGHRWTLVPAGDVPGRFNAAMAYDARRHALVRFGGWTGSTRTADTWLFTVGRWQQADVAGPDPRNHAAMAYDHNRGVTVIVGGHDGERVYGDTWEWDGWRWALRAGVPPRRRVDNGH
jgi:hypothetical protein